MDWNYHCIQKRDKPLPISPVQGRRKKHRTVGLSNTGWVIVNLLNFAFLSKTDRRIQTKYCRWGSSWPRCWTGTHHFELGFFSASFGWKGGQNIWILMLDSLCSLLSHFGQWGSLDGLQIHFGQSESRCLVYCDTHPPPGWLIFLIKIWNEKS